MEIKTVDSRGRLHLGKEFAGMSFFFQQVSETKIVLDLAVVVKAEEFQQTKSTPERAEAEPVAHAREVELKASPPPGLDEVKEEEDHVPAVQAADTESQPDVVEKVPSPQMKKKASKPSLDLPPLNITPELQRVLAEAVKEYFTFIRREPKTGQAMAAAFSMARDVARRRYLAEMKPEEGISEGKIFAALRKEGLWLSKKPNEDEIKTFFKDMKARLEAAGVEIFRKRGKRESQ